MPPLLLAVLLPLLPPLLPQTTAWPGGPAPPGPGPGLGAPSEAAAEESSAAGGGDLTLAAAAVPVRNLTVTARALGGGSWLQLNVSWEPADEASESQPGFQAPTGYRVTVMHNSSESRCTASQAFKTLFVPTNTTWLQVPADKPSTDEFRVVSNCTYNVTVEWFPLPNHSVPVLLSYFVPECLDKCRCRRPLLPAVSLDVAELENPSGDLLVRWRLLPANRTAAAAGDRPERKFNVSVRLGEYYFRSSGGGRVYNITWSAAYRGASAARVPAALLKPGFNYSVLAAAVDELGCRGPEANRTFALPGPQGSSTEGKEKHKPLWVAGMLALGLLLAGLLLLSWRLCSGWLRPKLGLGLGAGQLHRPRAARGAYNFVSSNGRLNVSTQERNVIYVEQEIEEAKARGEADTHEISYSRLLLGRQIGKGAFGRVFLAQAEAIAGTPGFQNVAVKKLKHRATSDEVEEFLAEIAMMKKVGRHPNIVTMLGCCTLAEPYCMLMEYVPCGDLLHYLRRLRLEYERQSGSRAAAAAAALARQRAPSPAPPGLATAAARAPRYVDLLLGPDSEGSYVQPDLQQRSSNSRTSATDCAYVRLRASGMEQPRSAERHLLSSSDTPSTNSEMTPPRLQCVLDPKELQHFAVQIARGMAFLEKKQITHRDLAARNVLIDENKVLKISDFGLSRTGIYVNTKRKKVPLRWLSIEAMRDSLYSSKSDVWAFAIVLWEIGTLGGFPYPTVADMNLLSFLLDGKRLEKPDNCSDELYQLMSKCWSYSPDMRPSFSELAEHLDSTICRKRVYVDFSSLSPGYTFPPTEEQATKVIEKNVRS